MEDLPILDIAARTQAQLAKALEIFGETCEKTLLPLHEIDKDPVRKELNDRFAPDVWGVPGTVLQPDGPMDLLRKKLAHEPSIRGNK